MQIKIINKEYYSTNDLPGYATPGSAAIDLKACESFTVRSGQIVAVRTGLAIWIEYEHVMGLLTPRSGLGTRGLVLANTVGIIDSDFQGEIVVRTFNRSSLDIEIAAGDRFAQLCFVPIIKPKFIVVEGFSEKTKRGNGGFGSTGE